MNRTLTFAAILVVAAPLFAADPKPVSNPTQQVPQGDSPLVAAAKRAHRLGKKPTNVITNETLVTTGGHFTTTTQQAPITQLPPLAGIQTAPPPATAPQASATAKQKKAEDERQRVVKELRMQYEGETLNPDVDPAAVEHQMQQVAQPGDKKP
jgi:hypothetical protein